MVFLDFTQQNEAPRTEQFKIAPVSDRILAFFFDVVIFSPLFSLVLAPLLKQIEVRYYTSPDSTEFSVLIGVCFISIIFLATLTQAFFLSRYGATPGKMFMKMKVVPMHGTGEIRFAQALMRSGLWSLEVLFLMIPFVEVMSHHYRRPLHDRASDTMVVTLKAEGDLGPHPLETHFVRVLLLVFVCGFLFWGGVIVQQAYQMALRGDFKQKELEKDKYLCSSVSELIEEGQNRLDFVIARYLAGEDSEKCLLTEADFALWQTEPRQQAWGYLAKAFYYQFDEEKSDAYLEKVCEVSANSEPCFLTQFIDQSEVILKQKSSLTSMMLSLKQKMKAGDYEGYLKSIRELSDYPGFETFTQKETVRGLWVTGDQEKAKGALLGAWGGLDGRNQAEISSWLCQEELDMKCGNEEYLSCNSLREILGKDHYQGMTKDMALAIVQERECKKSSEPSLLIFHSLFEDNPDLKLYTGALSTESPWTSEKRLQVMRDLAFARQGSVGIQKRALMYLSQKSKLEKDFVQIESWIKKNSDQKWIAGKIQKQVLATTEKLNMKKRLPASAEVK